MLTLPSNSSPIINIVGIDPGSETLGVAVLSVDVTTMQIVSSIARTYIGSKMAGKNNWIGSLHGDRVGRILAHEDNLLEIFNYYNPLIIVSESPFINTKFPQSGLVLTEVLCSIRRAVMRYSIWKELCLVDPPTVKKAVGAPGNAQKEVVKEKIMQLTDLNYSGDVPLEYLDEHSIDALAVAYFKFKNL